jgi:hypothetical protein|tara:strand:+ start:77 stop:355 length:279 start_codon:yes stop_codon:yes gene_type:complete
MLTTTEMNKLNSLLAKADQSQMRQIGSMFNAQHKAKQQVAKNSFSIGQNVWFTSKIGSRIEGVITKVMVKNIQMKTADGGLWRVTPTLLKSA